MYKHILIATDGSELAQKGVDHGLELAASLRARATIITVTEPFPFHAHPMSAGWVPLPADVSGYEQAQKESAEALLASVKNSAAGRGVDASTLHVPDGRPAEAIVKAAEGHGCDLIVMASHGRRGVGRLLLGSQTSEVLVHSTVPVLVIR